MRYSIELRIDRIYVKGYRFLSFAKNMGENVSNKYGQSLLYSAKKSTTDAIKTALKRAIKKTTEATGNLIGKTLLSKCKCLNKSPTELHSKVLQNDEMEAPKKDAYLQKKDSKLLMN